MFKILDTITQTIFDLRQEIKIQKTQIQNRCEGTDKKTIGFTAGSVPKR